MGARHVPGLPPAHGRPGVSSGPQFYRGGQVAAVVLLAARLEIGPDDMQSLLADNAQLRQAMGFRHAPGRAFFEGIAAMLQGRTPGRASFVSADQASPEDSE